MKFPHAEAEAGEACAAIGLWAAAFPIAWLSLFGKNSAMLAALGGGWLALRWSGDPPAVFLAQGAALAAFGAINAAAVACGAWFGPVAWRSPSLATLHKRLRQ